jgi:hypothetical protein
MYANKDNSMKVLPIETVINQIHLTIDNLSTRSQELLVFLRHVKDEELEQLREHVNDYDDAGVSTQNILDCIAVWDYLHELILGRD